MADLTLKASDSIKKLGKDLENLSASMEDAVNEAVGAMAAGVHASIVELANAKLNSTRENYINSVHMEKVSENSYVISLEGDFASKIEEGQPSYDLTEVLLRSKKTVEQGSRVGEPWVQTNKMGKKFAHVPLSPLGKGAVNLPNIKAWSPKQQDYINIGKTFMGEGEKLPRLGKIGTFDVPGIGNVTKYQMPMEDKRKTQEVQHIYVAYRTTSESGKHWVHPGMPGVKIFDTVSQQLEEKMDQAIEAVFQGWKG